jgi:DNA-binding transcriptional ArsR family regulator
MEAEATSDRELEDMAENARRVAALMKALAHEGRLMILCHLATGERSVSEIERLLQSRQAAVSQQLTRLRLEGLVAFRREGKAIHYRIADPRAARLLALLYEMFCSPSDASPAISLGADRREGQDGDR